MLGRVADVFGQIFFPHLFETDFSEKTPKEIFAAISFPGRLIPEDLRERIAGKIEIINAAPEDNETLQIRLKNFVNDIILLTNALKKIKAEVDKHPYSNQANLDDAHYDSKQAPGFFLDPISRRVMTHPVIINNGLETQIIVNFRALLQYWHENNCKFAHPTHTETLIETIEFYPSLQKVITDFVKHEIKKVKGFDISEAAIDTQILAVTEKMKKFAGKRTAMDIMEHDHPAYFRATPEKFIAANTSGYIITHPVKIDDRWIVCFLELQKFWQKHPYQNPFNPEHKIRSLIYLDELKAQIDTYTTDPKSSLDEAEKAAKQAEPIVLAAPHAVLFSTPAAASAPMPLSPQRTNNPAQQSSSPPPLPSAIFSPLLWQSTPAAAAQHPGLSPDASPNGPRAGFQHSA